MSGNNDKTQDAQETSEQYVVTRYTYRYHNDSINTLNLLLLGLVALVGSFILLIFVQITTKPSPLHFKLNENMQIIEPVPLDLEGISTAALLNWVNEFTMKAFSFNYSNVQKQSSKMAPYFSDAALRIYTDLLNTDPDFRTIADQQYVISIVPKAAPEILVGKAFQDRYAWQIRVTANIYFSNALVRGSHDVILDYLIWRVAEMDFPLGINVATFTRTVVGRTGAQSVTSNTAF